jgi:hypothetical protein
MSTLYSIGQMNQVGDALENAGFTPAEVEKFRQFSNLSGIRALINGLAEIQVVKHVIDCDANPLIPYDGWNVEEHKKGGQFAWDPTKVTLHLSPNQAEGKSIAGNRLRKELESQPVFNANLLDYLVKHPHLIPEEWKQDEKGRTRYIFFWGTIYRDSDSLLFVRSLCWGGGRWRVGDFWLDGSFGVVNLAAVSAS